MRLRKKQLMDLGASETQAAKFLPALNRLLPANDIDTPRRVTHFLSQVYHESARLKRTEENLNYGADGLRITFGKYYKTKKAAEDHHRKPSKIASHVYANRLGNGDEASGDGWTYRGRGLIQLTGKSNYRAFSGFVGVDCVEAPDLVKDRFPVDSAVFFWARNNINAKADLDDVRAVTRAINGGLNGLDDRVALLARAKDLLATGEIESLATLETVTHQVSATALNLRSSPVVSPSTRIATLPQGTELQKLPTATKRGWFHVRVVFQQRLQEGYVSASNRYLKRVTVAAPSEPPPVLPELSIPEPRATLPVAHLKENRADITRARDGGRAYPLGEVPRPRRRGTTPAKRAEQLIEIVRYLDCERPSHLRWKPSRTTTYCNIYAYDYCCLAGVYLPRVWWMDAALARIRSGSVLEAKYNSTVRELNANSLYDWLEDYGLLFGWQREMDVTILQAAANNGEACLIVAKRRDTNRPGHIVAVVPEHDGASAARDSADNVRRPLQSQAGRNNHRFSSGSNTWWTGANFEFSAYWRHA